MARKITLHKEQFAEYFEQNPHPTVERRLDKAEESIGVAMIRLYYSKSGRLYKVKHYFEGNLRPMDGGELEGYLQMINPTNHK